MFVQILNELSDKVWTKIKDNPKFEHALDYALEEWCNKLNLAQDVSRYIKHQSRNPEIYQVTDDFWKEWKYAPNKPKSRFLGYFKRYMNEKIFTLIDFNSPNDMTVILLIAFVLTGVGLLYFLLNQQQSQNTRTSDYQLTIPNVSSSPVPKITKQFLVLVVSASQADFIESLESIRRINSNDAEELYRITKYLWLGYESEFYQKIADINRYSVSKGEESEYDIYLVYMELKQADEGFNPSVNQLDRYDAFRKLADLAVNLTISPRLQMEAYGNIEVYNR